MGVAEVRGSAKFPVVFVHGGKAISKWVVVYILLILLSFSKCFIQMWP